MIILRQSTASQSVLIGPFVDPTVGSAETGLTINASDIRLSKNGGNFAAKNSGGGTHDGIGYYTITLDATDTNTVGRLQLAVDHADALAVYHEFQVVEEAVYDAMFASSATGPVTSSDLPTNFGDLSITASDGRVDVGAWLGTAVTLGNSLPDVNVASWNDTTVSTALQTPADVRAEIDSNSTQLAAILEDTGTTLPATLATIDANVDAILVDTGTTLPATLATIDGIVDAILVDTAEIGAAGAGLTAVPWNASWDAEVQSEVQDAIEANHLDHMFAADYDPASPPGVATAWANELVESDSGVTRFTVNAMENAPSGTGASAASIRAEIDANSTQLAAIVADTNELQTDWADGGRLDLLLDGASAPSAAAIRAEIDANSTQLAAILTDTGTTIPATLATIDGIVDAILVDTGTTLPGTLSSMDGKIDTVDANVDSILVDTGTTLPASLSSIDGKIDTIDSNVDAVLVDTDTTIPGLIATVDTVVDAIAANVTSLLGAFPERGEAYSNIPVTMVDATDNVTPETGLTVTVTRSIDGGALASATGSISEVGGGSYSFDASAADMNGAIIEFFFSATGAATSKVVVVTRT